MPCFSILKGAKENSTMMLLFFGCYFIILLPWKPQGREEGAVIDDWEDPDLSVYKSTDRYGFMQ